MTSLHDIAARPAVIGLWSSMLGFALWFAPIQLAARVHAAVWDGLRPGLIAAAWCEAQGHAWLQAREDERIHELELKTSRLQADVDAEQARTRRLTAQLLSLRDRNAAGLMTSASPELSERLFHPAIVEASVLGQSLSQEWKQGAILDHGAKHGVRESALVLRSTRPLIDLSGRQQVDTEDLLLLGQAVYGKVETVGVWTSTFIPITDPSYRGRAQLVREAEDGPHWGATGLLRGDGQRCQLEGIGGNDSVRVGDLVFTADRDAALGTALSYGTVIEARLGLDDREWHIVVQPLPQPEIVSSVQVLRAALNPQRLWSK